MDDMEYTGKQLRTIESLDLHYSLEVNRAREKGKSAKAVVAELLEKIGFDRVARSLEDRRS